MVWELAHQGIRVLCTIAPVTLFFVQNTNSSLIMNHLIEEELQSPNSSFSGALDMKSRCKLIQCHIDSDTGTLWLTRNLTRSSSLLVVH